VIPNETRITVTRKKTASSMGRFPIKIPVDCDGAIVHVPASMAIASITDK
jgi:hypothetical protein